MKRMAFALAAVTALALAAPAAASTWRPSTPPLPVDKIVEDWPLRGVVMSPDGKHIAGIAGSPGQNPVVKVWSTDNLAAPPRAFGSRQMRFVSVNFIKNDRLLIIANQPLAYGAQRNWTNKALLTDLEGKEFIEPLESGGTKTELEDEAGRFLRVSLFNRLPSDPQHVLMSYGNLNGTSDIYRVNVYTGRGNRVARGTDLEQLFADRNGNIVAKSELRSEGGDWRVHLYTRPVGGEWRRLDSVTENIAVRSEFTPLRFSADGTKAWVRTDRTADMKGHTNFMTIRELDMATGAMSEPVFQNTEYDATRMIVWRAGDEEGTDADPIAGFCFDGPAEECVYTNPTLQAIQARLERAFPGQFVYLRNIQRSGNLVLVEVTGPAFPTTWYVLRDQRQITRIGSVLEGFDTKNLGPGQWVTYKARDGMDIPAVLFLPPGYDKARDGRIPLVVLPHGGPWARDDMAFDISFWPQMFATRGFAVLQPQYRGSAGLGRALWFAGDREWGAKMQDDKDDGAKWLVEQGVADPNRMMMYGYSYGGFAASAAAARSGGASKGLWQCAISGAPVIDMDRLRTNEWGDSRIQRVFQGDTVRGWNPQANLDQVVIPWLIFHGDYDRQADTAYSQSAAARMRALRKPDFRYVEIREMAHTLIQMTPDHRRQFIPLILNWVDTNCGQISASVDSRQMAAAD